MDLFWRGADGTLRQRFKPAGGSWTVEINLGGAIASQPSVVSWVLGRVDVFARGVDGRLAHRWFVTGTGWSAWESLDGVLSASPSAAAWAPGRIDAFVRATDGSLRHTWLAGSTWAAAARYQVRRDRVGAFVDGALDGGALGGRSLRLRDDGAVVLVDTRASERALSDRAATLERMASRSALAMTAVVIAVSVGCSSPAGPGPGAAGPGGPVPGGPGTPDGATAVRELDALPVKGRAPKTGYSRARYGRAWADVDHNGCDTRNDVLARDLQQRTVRAGTGGCVILSGTFTDPYTGRVLGFSKSMASAVQIDHVVALSDAWQTGAQQWSDDRRLAFANDPRNLQATDGATNQQKGDADAASWLPPNRGYRCTYVERQITVKSTYGLWVTPAEHDALARILGSCPR
ncbi:MAG TPA: DUF1524 domain-containing protein [Frankiaceae bacterium]|nr:DUF1524 domain-containing protein [Frankiaceae bacterium]